MHGNNLLVEIKFIGKFRLFLCIGRISFSMLTTY